VNNLNMYDILTKDGLIITGAQGTGKSILAKIIAESRGKYITASLEDLIGPTHFSPAGIDKVNTAIVEEFNPTPKNIGLAKVLMTNQRLEVKFQMRDPFTIETPHFIFVTNMPLVLDADERRFKVIEMKSYVR